MLYATNHKKFPTVSHIALDSKITKQVFFWGLTVSALLFGLLMYGWVIPNFRLGLVAQIITGFITIFQVQTGKFPVNNNKLGGIHTLFSSSLGISMFLLVGLFAHTESISLIARLSCAVITASMIMLLATSVKYQIVHTTNTKRYFWRCGILLFYRCVPWLKSSKYGHQGQLCYSHSYFMVSLADYTCFGYKHRQYNTSVYIQFRLL